MASEKQQLARSRNWAKLRLSGMYIDKKGLSMVEALQVDEIRVIIDSMLDQWDNMTEFVLKTNLKPHQCEFCGRRSNVERVYEMVEFSGPNRFLTLCKKHFKEMNDE